MRMVSVVAVLGVIPITFAAAALVGLGVLRELGSGQVALAAASLTALPIVGIWALLGRSPGAAAAAAWVWPALLLAGLPGYFPGEMPGAVGTGLAVLAAPAGREASAAASRIGEGAASALATAPQGEAPPPDAARPTPECLPAPIPTAGDQVAIPYEGQGHSMAIPVQFGEIELSMLFDTGASVTTLDAASLRRLGVRVPSDAPEITLRTANGERTTRLVLLPKLWIGGLPVEGVTVGVCEECADDRVAGLLGLNVSSQFLVTVDTSRKEVVFQDRGAEPERLSDVAPWLHIEATATIFPDRRVEVRVDAVNDADRVVAEATVGLRCGDESFVAKIPNIPPNGTASTTAALPRGTDCKDYRVSLDHARW